MLRLLRQLVHSVEDRIGLQGALIVVAVVVVAAGALSLASRLEPLAGRVAPNPDNRDDRAPVAPVQTIVPVQPIQQAPVLPATPVVAPAVSRTAPALEPATARLSAPAPQGTAIPKPRPAAASPSSTLPRTVSLPPPRPVSLPLPRPVMQAAEQSGQRSRSTGAPPRESRRQIARNARNRPRAENYQAEDAYIGPAAAGGGRNSTDASSAEDAYIGPTTAGLGAYALVAEARQYIGTNPTDMARLWCARFMNYVLKRSGYQGTGSDAAMSFARYGRRISGPRIGAIAVMRRKGGGHVGVVSGIDRNGNPILISGNTPNRRGGRIVAEHVYPRSRIIAYVMPRRRTTDIAAMQN